MIYFAYFSSFVLHLQFATCNCPHRGRGVASPAGGSFFGAKKEPKRALAGAVGLCAVLRYMCCGSLVPI